MRTAKLLALALVLLSPLACGDDADSLRVGAACSTSDDCNDDQTCLAFKGGYCGVADCVGDDDCPVDSACVAHDDGNNYCFRLCSGKDDCNANRSEDDEANCSSSVTFVDTSNDAKKACVPPSA